MEGTGEIHSIPLHIYLLPCCLPMLFSPTIPAGFDAISILDGDNVNIHVFYTGSSWSLQHTYYTPSNDTWNVSNPNVVAQKLEQESPVSAFVFNSTSSPSQKVGPVGLPHLNDIRNAKELLD